MINNDLNFKACVYCKDPETLYENLVLEHPAMIYIVNDNVHEDGYVCFSFSGYQFYVSTGGIHQNNTHYLPKGAKIEKISNLGTVKFCYFD